MARNEPWIYRAWNRLEFWGVILAILALTLLGIWRYVNPLAATAFTGNATTTLNAILASSLFTTAALGVVAIITLAVAATAAVRVYQWWHY